MSQHLTQNLVDLGRGTLGFDGGSKLGLYHHHRSLSVRPLVVVSREIVPIEVVEVEQPLPQTIERLPLRHALRAGLEGDERRSAHSVNGMNVTAAAVRLVPADLANFEGLGGLGEQRRQLGCVRRLKGCSLDGGDDVRLDAAHQVGLNPTLSASLFAPLVVEPPLIVAGGKARAVDGKVHLDGLKRSRARLNQRFQHSVDRRPAKQPSER